MPVELSLGPSLQLFSGVDSAARQSPTSSSTSWRALADSWSLILVVLIAAVWLYQSPYSVSDLSLTPDSVEYALASLQFLETGRYEIIVQNHALPPRYPPWFSVIIMPAYALFGHQPGNAILPITGFAVVGIAFAWAIGRRIASAASAILAGLALLAVPTYSTSAGYVMTDVPCAVLMLGACLLYLRIRSQPSSTWFDLLAGALVGSAMLLRPVFAAMLLPFLFAIVQSRKGFFRRIAALLLLPAAAIAATLAYNRAMFGSPLRNGYHFWTPVPSDYPALAFSFRHLNVNLGVVAHTAFPILFVIALALWWILRTKYRPRFDAARRTLWQTLVFFILTAGPILLFHLIYFFPAERFYLPLLAGTAVVGGALAGLLINDRSTGLFKLLLAGTLLFVIGLRTVSPEPIPCRRLAAECVRQYTPKNAIVISAIDPVYLERMGARGTSRRIVPLSRDVEYASKLLAPRRIDHPEPPPANWHDHRSAGLIRGGAKEAVPFVASEQIASLAAEAQRGAPVFLDATFLTPADAYVIAQLRKHFLFTRRAPALYELRPR